MTALIDVATYLPRQDPIVDRQHELGVTDVDMRRLTRGFGYDRIARDADETEADIMLAATTKLAGLVGCEERIRYVIRPRSVRSGAAYPQSPLRQVVDALGLRDADTFTMNEQACASGLLAVDMAGGLLAEDGDVDALALVIVGEKTYGAVSTFIPGMAVLGEAVAAILVAADGTRNRMLSYSATTVPIPNSGLVMDKEAVRAFGEIYGTTLASTIEQALAAARITAEDLTLYLPHNVSKLLCLQTAKSLGLDATQVITENIGQLGHCWGADPFLNYATAVEMGRLDPGDLYLMTSVGLGATFSAAIFRR